MKKVLLFPATWIILVVLTCCQLTAQVTFSRFDFDTAPYTTASIGPNATSIDPDMVSDGNAAYINANCGALKGIDLYAVLGADGTPLALTDSRHAAIANAIENDLVPLSVH